MNHNSIYRLSDVQLRALRHLATDRGAVTTAQACLKEQQRRHGNPARILQAAAQAVASGMMGGFVDSAAFCEQQA